jgi:hypothetical protein
LLTGRYQVRFGHERNPYYDPSDHREGLPLTERLFPEYLCEAGYATGWIGKWQLGAAPEFWPENRGFAETFGFMGGGHQYQHWQVSPAAEYRVSICRNGQPVEVTEHLTVAFGHEAAAFVRRHATEPWFLYLAFNAPHTPHQPTPERLAKFEHILTGEKSGTPHQQLFWREEELGQWGERDGATKLVRRTKNWAGKPPSLTPLPQTSFELFDLSTDLREANNLATSKAGDLNQMNTQLDAWCKQAAPLAFTGVRGREKESAATAGRSKQVKRGDLVGNMQLLNLWGQRPDAVQRLYEAAYQILAARPDAAFADVARDAAVQRLRAESGWKCSCSAARNRSSSSRAARCGATM